MAIQMKILGQDAAVVLFIMLCKVILPLAFSVWMKSLSVTIYMKVIEECY